MSPNAGLSVLLLKINENILFILNIIKKIKFSPHEETLMSFSSGENFGIVGGGCL